MALAASWTHGNVTEFESHTLVIPRGWALIPPSQEAGRLISKHFATGVAAAASSQVLWLPVVLLLALWIKLASPGPHCFSAEARRLLQKTFHDRQILDTY